MGIACGDGMVIGNVTVIGPMGSESVEVWDMNVVEKYGVRFVV